MRSVFYSMAILLLTGNVVAQQPNQVLTLRQCIDSAIKNNIEVQQRSLQIEATSVNKAQSKLNLLPTLNGNINHGTNQGRSIDPFTNTYINQTVNYANYGLGSDLILFNGFNLRNIIKQTTFAQHASKAEWEQSKDFVTLNVILAYLQVLSNEDLTALAQQQVEVSRQQVERLEKLNKEGAISPPLLYDLRGQLKEGELNVVNSRNAWRTSLLQLTQLMNIPFTESLKLEKIDNANALAPYTATSKEVYEKALEHMGAIKAAEWRRKSAAYAVKATRGLLYPTVFLSGNMNTNYSSAATQDRLVNTTEVPTADYVIVNGVKTPVVVKQPTFTSERISYNTQLKNNIFSGIGVGIRVPIFNSFQVRNRVKLANIEYKNTALVEDGTKRQLRQEIEQAYLNMTNAWERYKISVEQVAAYAESFRAAEVRFNAGVGTSVDYLIAKNNLDRANLNLVMTRYDYVLRKQILDYYNR
ncbi:MAG TPA: TolC family protein [Flavisolibacter sp.]|nr:TolC family protein [Flavisolibacter sp.]